jgi:hypothetical protein
VGTSRNHELVTTFADQAVIAIENARLFEAEQQRTRELSESLEQQTATSDVLSIISSSPGDLEPVFEAMLESATRICDAKYGNLYQFADGAFRIVASHSPSPELALERLRGPPIHAAPGTGLGRVLETKRLCTSLTCSRTRAIPTIIHCTAQPNEVASEHFLPFQ